MRDLVYYCHYSSYTVTEVLLLLTLCRLVILTLWTCFFRCYYSDEQMQYYRAQIEATNKGGFVFKLGSASAILGVDFRRFQQNPPQDVPFVIRLHSDAVFASLAARTTEAAGTHFT